MELVVIVGARTPEISVVVDEVVVSIVVVVVLVVVLRLILDLDLVPLIERYE